MNKNTAYNPRLHGVTGISGTIEKDMKIIIHNLNKELEKIKNRTNKGLLLAAIEVRRDMEEKPPLIPLKYGNLRASWFITTRKGVSPELHALEVKTAKFRKADTPEILKRLREEHKQTISEAQGELSKYPIGVMMGFSAFYAAPVHEMVDEKFAEPVNWSKSGSGPKFFQAALYRNYDNIINIVKANAQVRP